MSTKIVLHRKRLFSDTPYNLLESAGFSVTCWRYDSGVEAITLANGRGHLVVLPYMGQMIWDAEFDGYDLTMKNMFRQPLPASTIVETYGCFLFHSGLLRNGCPTAEDDHPLHGEMPCAPMDRADLILGEDEEGPFLKLTGEYEYVIGFGSHYLACPSICLRPNSALFDVSMEVENLGSNEMELMYMCHLNPVFVEGAKILQPAAWTAAHVATRTSIPAHVRPTKQWKTFLREVAADPARMQVLDEQEKYTPEFVFFLRNLNVDAAGMAHFLMKLPQGGGCYCGFHPQDFDHTVRWILADADQQVAAFALPATCEPEGYIAEKAKGNVKLLGGGQSRSFTVRTGWLSELECAAVEPLIKA
ncbi:MAG: DUF4432 domain-containing protein [Deltaproteobacteria bacterium]|nr:MAG: DUF4432 domain-containing protein [Deltaproteobacteria bacterium]